MALNAALGLVVIEFRNSAGAVVSSIPTTQQIQAYQAWQDSGIGRQPNLGASMATAAPPVAPTLAVASTPVRAQAPVGAQAPTAASAPAPTRTSAPATFGGSSPPTHLGFGV
jgi:hypothetical protein